MLTLKVIASLWILSTPEIFPSEVKTDLAPNGIAYYYMPDLSLSERFLNLRLKYHSFAFISIIGVFTIVEPIALEIAKACCFKKPRRGQLTSSGTLRPYSIESLYHVNNPSEFFYDMLKVNKYRRALLLLNNEDIDEADDEADKKLASIS